MQVLDQVRQVSIGESLKRKEDARLITGSGSYVDDADFKRLAHASILRSPYAHALIRRIDISKALELPGVIDIVTGEDVKATTKPFPQAISLPIQDYCLAVGEVVYVGQPLAAVVARDRYVSEDALALIEVEYEPLDVIVDARSAVKEKKSAHLSLQESRVFHKVLSYGDVEQVFANATHVFKDKFTFESYSAMPLETFAIVADYNRSTGMLVIYDNCQFPLYAATSVSSALAIPTNKIRFVERDIGGGFGIKSMLPVYDVLLSVLSMRAGIPVKWVETRTEHMQASSHGTRRQYETEVAVDSKGKIMGLKVRAFEDVGAFLRRPGQTALVSCLRAFSGPYRFRTFEYDMNLVITNKCPAGPSRGNGKNHHAFLLERIIERVSSELKLDPLQIRLRNFIQPTEFPYLSVNGCLYDSGNYPEALKKVANVVKYDEFHSLQGKLKQEGRYVGIGFALTIDPAASSMAQDNFFHSESKKWGTSETASLHMDWMGNVTVALASVPQGQGHETVASAIVSDILGINTENVTVFTGFDSARNIGTPTSGTYSSRFAPIGASAVALASKQLKSKLFRVASNILKTSETSLELSNGRVTEVKNPKNSISLSELASIVYSGMPDQIPIQERSLDSIVTYTYPFGRNNSESLTNLASTYAYQAHVAIVEVDIETGGVKILHYATVDDSGKSLNKMIVEGQVHGGVFNGMAASLFECFVYDAEGQLLTSSFTDYLAPTARDVPNLEVHLMETPNSLLPLGAKGVGESGALGPQPAIINAIEDALRDFGVKISSSHVTPELIHKSIRNSGKQPSTS